MKNFIKNFIIAINGDFLLRLRNKQPRVLFWHGVDHRIDTNVEQEIFDIDVFERQIAYLNKYYEIISIEEFEHRLYNENFLGKEVVLTFDDGYANNLYVVAPILNRLKLPFTVFVSTEHIDNGTFFPTSVNRIITRGAGLTNVDIPSQKLSLPLISKENINYATDKISHLLKTLPLEQVRAINSDLINNVDKSTWEKLKQKYKSVRPMTWEEVKILSELGATIGSHCKWHICCHNRQSEDEIFSQISESKKSIEAHLNKPCQYFAYPNGDYTSYSNKCVEMNYRLGFSTQGKNPISKNPDNTIIPRISVMGNIKTFRILVNIYPLKK